MPRVDLERLVVAVYRPGVTAQVVKAGSFVTPLLGCQLLLYWCSLFLHSHASGRFLRWCCARLEPVKYPRVDRLRCVHSHGDIYSSSLNWERW